MSWKKVPWHECASWKLWQRNVCPLESYLNHAHARCGIIGQTNEWGKKLHFLFSGLVTWFFFHYIRKSHCFASKKLLCAFFFIRWCVLFGRQKTKLCLYRPRCRTVCSLDELRLKARVKRRPSRAWNGNNYCGDLNLAHEKCRWIRPPLLQAMKMSLDFKAQVWYMSKTSERSVRLYSQRLVQAEESRKKKEPSLLLPELQRCLTFSAWPSKGSLVFDPSLHFPLEFLSPFLL